MEPKKFPLQYLTQRLKLNEFRERDDFNLEIYNPMIDSVNYVWNKEYNDKNKKKIKKGEQQHKLKDVPKEFIIATRRGKPYFDLK